MSDPTPPPFLRRRETARERLDRLIIAASDEDYPDDAPTVMANDLEDIGIDPDSLATAPHLARRIREEEEARTRQEQAMRGREASARALHRAQPQRQDYRPVEIGPDGATPVDEDDGVEVQGQEIWDQDAVLLVAAVAIVPLVLALGAAIWMLQV